MGAQRSISVNKSTERNLLLGALCLATAAAIWGGTYVVSKSVLAYIPPMTLVVMRFLIAAVILGLVLLRQGQARVERRDWGRMARYGLVGYTISISAQFVGTKLSSAHMGAVITSASPVFIALFARWFLKETMTARKWGALFVATLGVLIVVGTDVGTAPKPMETGSWLADGGAMLGNLFLVLAAVTWGLYTVQGKSLTERYPALTVSFWATVCGVVFTLPLAGWEIWMQGLTLPTDPLVWIGVAFLGVLSTAVAFFLWVKGFELMDAGTAALFFFVQPVFGTFLGWLLLGETLTLTFMVGSLLILGSVAFSMRN